MKVGVVGLAILLYATCFIWSATSSIHTNNQLHDDSNGNDANNLLDTLHSFSVVRPTHLPTYTTASAHAADSNGVSSNDATVQRFTFAANDRHYDIEVTRSDKLFHPNYEEIVIDANGRVVERRPKSQVETNCYYQGRVIGESRHNTVTLSTCDDSNDRSAAAAISPPQRVSSTKSSLATQFSQFRTEATNQPSTQSLSMSLTGMIAIEGESPLFIEPAHPHAHRLASFEAGDHIVYRLSDVKEEGVSHCGVGLEHTQPHYHSTSTSTSTSSNQPSTTNTAIPSSISSSTRTTDSHTHAIPNFKLQANGNVQKYVEVVVFNDKKRYDLRGANTPNLSKQILNQVAVLYANTYALQFAYRFEIRLIAQVTFAYGDPYVAPVSQGTQGEISFSDLLTKFYNWQYTATSSAIPVHDNAILLSGYDFYQSTVGYANVGKMCSGLGESAAVVQATSSKPLQTASTVAHEMGHNFGMQHDDDSGTSVLFDKTYQNTYCAVDLSVKIMASSSTTQVWPYVWSNCSQKYIDDWFDGTPSAGTSAEYGNAFHTIASCLENVPTETWTNTTVVCGDGIIGGSEQCDCGLSNCTLVDPCCDGATCLLKSTAVCSNTDPCCENCAIVTDSRVCRAAVNADCDVAETCNGASSKCPANGFVRPGASCTWSKDSSTGSGLCYSGDCYSHDVSCLNIAPAVLKIFGTSAPNVTGQCFTFGDANADSCDVLSCGTTTNPFTQQCYNWDIGEGYVTVEDGVPCGSSKQCYNSACVSSSSLPYTDTLNANWSIGAYSECSSACGGTQTRTVKCVDGSQNQILSGYASSFCSSPMPVTSQTCAANASCAFDWNTGQFSLCSATCAGVMTRVVDCRDKANVVVNNTFCSQATKPASVMLCNTQISCSTTGSSTSRSSTGGHGSSTGQNTEESSGFFGVAALDKVLTGKFTVGGLLILLIGIFILLACCFCGRTRAGQRLTTKRNNNNMQQDLADLQQQTELTSR